VRQCGFVSFGVFSLRSYSLQNPRRSAAHRHDDRRTALRTLREVSKRGLGGHPKHVVGCGPPIHREN